MVSPRSAAMPYFQKAEGLYDPYVQQGQQAYGQLNPIYSQMASDPGAYLDSLMKGYAPSESYKQKFGQMSQAAANTAAAGGMRGSLSDIQNQAGLAQSLMGEDMQQWLQNVMGMQGAGLQGLGHFYDTGYDATNNLSNIYGTEGQLAYRDQADKNAKRAQMIKALTSMLGTGAGLAIAGPMGGAFGGMLGGQFGNMFG